MLKTERRTTIYCGLSSESRRNKEQENETQELMTLAGLMVISLTATSWAQSPKMKMTTPIPASITTPDEVETSIGTLKFLTVFPQMEP